MTSFKKNQNEITPELLLRAYSCGIFPMAESARDTALYWVSPELRGVIPLDAFHLPRRLARTIRQDVFEVHVDRDFEQVIELCAAPAPGRRSTWINQRIRLLYRQLFDMGYCHTVEAWREERLVGGLYGVHLGGVFYGESMFSRERDASKVAVCHLAARLIKGGITLLDTQFLTEHLVQFGTREMPRDIFQDMLEDALQVEGRFLREPPAMSGAQVVSILRPGS